MIKIKKLPRLTGHIQDCLATSDMPYTVGEIPNLPRQEDIKTNTLS